MAYNPIIVANAVLKRAKERGLSVDHMKLQKLVFLVHAWSLALKNAPAVVSQPEAWTYGPVFSELYSLLRNQGRADITNLIPSYNAQSGRIEPLVPNSGDQDTWQMVEQVLDRYGRLSAVQLSTLSHESGGPWDQARNARLTSIPDGTIQAYYRDQFQRGNARI